MSDRVRFLRQGRWFLLFGLAVVLLSGVVLVILHSYSLARESNKELEELRTELGRLRAQLSEIQRLRNDKQQATDAAVTPRTDRGKGPSPE